MYSRGDPDMPLGSKRFLFFSKGVPTDNPINRSISPAPNANVGFGVMGSLVCNPTIG